MFNCTTVNLDNEVKENLIVIKYKNCEPRNYPCSAGQTHVTLNAENVARRKKA